MKTPSPIPSRIAEIVVTYHPAVRPEDMPRVSRSKDVAELALTDWDDVDYVESVKVMLLTQQNRIIGMRAIAKGGISNTVIDERLILQTALKANAVGIILLHNHPSGNLQPSASDITLTRSVKDACQACKLSLIDHVIVTGSNGSYSFADEGLL